MLYCSFEPGLFILQGLAPHETNKAFAVVKSLISHKKMMDQMHVQIPMTRRYVDRIYDALNTIPIKNPPLESDLRQYILAALAKMSSPPLPPAELDGTTLQPDFTSEWIDKETKCIWLDSLTAAMFEEYTDDKITLSAATWFRQNIPTVTQVLNPDLCEQLGVRNRCWDIPVLTDELDWNELFYILQGWPAGLDSTLVDIYAKKHLGISSEQLGQRRKIIFSRSCYRNILRENDVNIKKSIIEVISCRAFNCIKPKHNDETITGQPGVRRVYVRKMAPPVRLHYVMDDETITYTLYSNDHDRGL